MLFLKRTAVHVVIASAGVPFLFAPGALAGSTRESGKDTSYVADLEHFYKILCGPTAVDGLAINLADKRLSYTAQYYQNRAQFCLEHKASVCVCCFLLLANNVYLRKSPPERAKVIDNLGKIEALAAKMSAQDKVLVAYALSCVIEGNDELRCDVDNGQVYTKFKSLTAKLSASSANLSPEVELRRLSALGVVAKYSGRPLTQKRIEDERAALAMRIRKKLPDEIIESRKAAQTAFKGKDYERAAQLAKYADGLVKAMLGRSSIQRLPSRLVSMRFLAQQGKQDLLACEIEDFNNLLNSGTELNPFDKNESDTRFAAAAIRNLAAELSDAELVSRLRFIVYKLDVRDAHFHNPVPEMSMCQSLIELTSSLIKQGRTPEAISINRLAADYLEICDLGLLKSNEAALLRQHADKLESVLLDVAAVQAKPYAGEPFVIPYGTKIRIVMKDEVDSKHLIENEPVHAATREDISIDGKVRVPANSVFSGIVSRRGWNFRVNLYYLVFNKLTLPDGSTIPVSVLPVMRGDCIQFIRQGKMEILHAVKGAVPQAVPEAFPLPSQSEKTTVTEILSRDESQPDLQAGDELNLEVLSDIRVP